MFGFFKRKKKMAGTTDSHSRASSSAQKPYMCLVQMNGSEEIARFKVFDGSRLGKGMDVDIPIRHPLINTRNHCTFFCREDQWHLISYGSYGTVVNGKALINKGDSAPLPSGSEIRLPGLENIFIFREK